jgi:hypothetical protein
MWSVNGVVQEFSSGILILVYVPLSLFFHRAYMDFSLLILNFWMIDRCQGRVPIEQHDVPPPDANALGCELAGTGGTRSHVTAAPLCVTQYMWVVRGQSLPVLCPTDRPQNVDGSQV